MMIPHPDVEHAVVTRISMQEPPAKKIVAQQLLHRALPKRLQLHLSTLLIVTLLASGFVWLNVREHSYGIAGWSVAGWPWLYYKWLNLQPPSVPAVGMNSTSEVVWRQPQSAFLWDWPALALDVAICLLLLALTGAAIEWVTRRMKRLTR
jgi:hypothetical protein